MSDLFASPPPYPKRETQSLGENAAEIYDKINPCNGKSSAQPSSPLCFGVASLGSSPALTMRCASGPAQTGWAETSQQEMIMARKPMKPKGGRRGGKGC